MKSWYILSPISIVHDSGAACKWVNSTLQIPHENGLIIWRVYSVFSQSHLQCVNMRTMVLEYFATFARRKSPSHVGKYISTMEHLGYVINMWSWKKSTLLMYESTQASRPNIACLGPKTFVIIADAFKQFQTSIAILVRKLFSPRRNWLIEQFVPFNCARTDRILAELVWRFPKIGVSPVIHWAAWDCPWNQPSIWGYHHDFVNPHDCGKTSLVPFLCSSDPSYDSGWFSP